MSTCQQCNQRFEIRDIDHAFYQKMGMPDPTLCATCSMQLRYSWRNERKLYRRQCEKCHKAIISCYSDSSERIIWCLACWLNDDWDLYAYGREFDFNRPFFEQFFELEKAIPHFNLFQDSGSENCDYTNYGFSNKNCYMAVCVWSENVYYSWGGIKARDCLDITKVQDSELCYECVDCATCSRLIFSQNCYQCHDSAFLVNCQNCEYCFGSINLIRKKYVFLGQQLSKEEYEKRMSSLEFNNQKIQEMLEYMKKISQQSIHRYRMGTNNFNSIGNYLDNTKNCYECFDFIDAEECAYCDAGGMARELWNCSSGGIASTNTYEAIGFTNFNNVAFHIYGRECYDCFYNQYCSSSHHLFGCIGLRRGEYAILNKKYTKSEYESLIPKIIEHMKKTGEWGKFFPAQYSPYCYNETLANEYFPLSPEEAVKKGWRWLNEKQHHARHDSSETLRCCTQCNHSFQLIPPEIHFYQKFKLPIPEYCPECRHKRRFNLRNPRRLYPRTCANAEGIRRPENLRGCQAALQTTYAPERAEIVYCEACYLREVY